MYNCIHFCKWMLFGCWLTAIGYLQGIPQIFFLNFNLWGLAVTVKDSYIPYPRAFQFLSWKKLNFFSVIWNLLLCKTLLLQSKISGTRISFSICLYLVPSFFACIPTRRSVLALETDSHSAKQSAQCCRADEVRAVHSTCSPVCYSWWHYVSFLLMTHFREASNWSHLCFSFKNKSACSHIQLLK